MADFPSTKQILKTFVDWANEGEEFLDEISKDKNDSHFEIIKDDDQVDTVDYIVAYDGKVLGYISINRNNGNKLFYVKKVILMTN